MCLDNAESGNQTRAILMQGECYNTTTPTLLIKSAKDYPKKNKTMGLCNRMKVIPVLLTLQNYNHTVKMAFCMKHK